MYWFRTIGNNSSFTKVLFTIKCPSRSLDSWQEEKKAKKDDNPFSSRLLIHSELMHMTKKNRLKIIQNQEKFIIIANRDMIRTLCTVKLSLLDCNLGRQNQIPSFYINQCHINVLKELSATTKVESCSKEFWRQGLDQKQHSKTRGVRSSSTMSSSSNHDLRRVALAQGDLCRLKKGSHNLLKLIFASTAFHKKRSTVKDRTWTKSKSK